ncbi:DUF1877 family protein [Streptomyces sp. NPDC005476]|uniref:DUF1877 family protein n=1 Tax=Streptomyces sp. NPDC005476 TaxID=3156882 RepID=UPI003455E718
MSMIGEYLRVTAAELDRAIQDPDWALGFVEEVQDAKAENSDPGFTLRKYSHFLPRAGVRGTAAIDAIFA